MPAASKYREENGRGVVDLDALRAALARIGGEGRFSEGPAVNPSKMLLTAGGTALAGAGGAGGVTGTAAGAGGGINALEALVGGQIIGGLLGKGKSQPEATIATTIDASSEEGQRLLADFMELEQSMLSNPLMFEGIPIYRMGALRDMAGILGALVKKKAGGESAPMGGLLGRTGNRALSNLPQKRG